MYNAKEEIDHILDFQIASFGISTKPLQILRAELYKIIKNLIVWLHNRDLHLFTYLKKVNLALYLIP
jgi:hypothetical protein